MNKTVFGVIVILVLIAISGYVYMHPPTTPAPASMGTYAYTCDSGAQFNMTPSADMSAVTLVAKGSAPFSTLTLYKMGDGNVYESVDSEVSFAGNGENVMITVGAATLNCSPVPSSDSAPFNWGDVQQ